MRFDPLRACADALKVGPAMHVMNARLSLLAALNGNRDHPAAPRTAAALAVEARAAVDAGAVSVHVHPYDSAGSQTLGEGHCSAVLSAIRNFCPGTPISLSTSLEIEGDPARRLALVGAWKNFPELVTANQGEEGIRELCEFMLARGVGIEAGLLSLGDAQAFIASGLAPRCVRVLIEPLDPDPEAAVTLAISIDQLLTSAGISNERIYHGDGLASWAVNRYGAARGCGIRTGLEDTAVLPDGTVASGNAELVTAAARLLDGTRHVT